MITFPGIPPPTNGEHSEGVGEQKLIKFIQGIPWWCSG